ncbi:universal stress protein [Halosegnis marinus]|uniref:Universal stress protein n=1 Tax=Halosegnis marinus TaxID=3034023 RepID=A0ABD5ZQ32_9EURY|nr:universal stress protein [Halosegnis sp. DT85]
MPDSLLVPVDGSPLARRAVRYAVENFPGASVTTLHVIDPVDSIVAAEAGGLPVADGWYERARERAAEIHEEARGIADEHGVELATATTVGRPARAILDYAEDHDVDLILLGSHGREGIERALLGSVAERVVRDGRRPVTVVR